MEKQQTLLTHGSKAISKPQQTVFRKRRYSEKGGDGSVCQRGVEYEMGQSLLPALHKVTPMDEVTAQQQVPNVGNSTAVIVLAQSRLLNENESAYPETRIEFKQKSSALQM